MIPEARDLCEEKLGVNESCDIPRLKGWDVVCNVEPGSHGKTQDIIKRE